MASKQLTSKFFNILLLVTVICALFLSNLANAKAPYKTVTDFLADQNTIRVVLDGAQGFGNQVANLNLMSRLRASGFKGTFEVIYPMDQATKLATLFQISAPLSSYYDFNDAEYGHVVLMTYREYLTRLQNHTIHLDVLGVSGAVEGDKMYDCGELQCDNNFANFTNSSYFLKLNPWHESEGDVTSIYKFGQNQTPIDIIANNQFWIMPIATLADTKQFLSMPAGQALVKNKPALPELISAIENQSFNFMAAYGWTITDIFNSGESTSTDYFYNVLQVITGARYAQLHGPEPLHKPLVIAVFYDYETQLAKISQLINSDDWQSFDLPGADNLKKAIKTLGLNQPGVVMTASISDPNTAKKMAALKPNQILLLSMGQLPKIVFDGIYNYSGANVLPQIREGQNSLNTLLLTGRPHLRCRSSYSSWEIGYDWISDLTLKSRMQDFYSNDDHAFCNANITWQTNPTIYKTVGDFIINASDVNSPFSRYFSFIKQQTMKPENDRILSGLEAVLKLVNEQSVK